MYFWERGRFGLPFMWRSNGLMIYAGDVPLFRRSMVWWMPVNWVSMIVVLAIFPLAWTIRKMRTKQEGGE